MFYVYVNGTQKKLWKIYRLNEYTENLRTYAENLDWTKAKWESKYERKQYWHYFKQKVWHGIGMPKWHEYCRMNTFHCRKTRVFWQYKHFWQDFFLMFGGLYGLNRKIFELADIENIM